MTDKRVFRVSAVGDADIHISATGNVILGAAGGTSWIRLSAEGIVLKGPAMIEINEGRRISESESWAIHQDHGNRG